jgi:hypothetical protein
MDMIKAIYIFIGVALVAAVASIFLAQRASAPEEAPVVELPVEVMCTADAMQCPDGSYVGRTGPECAFVCPEAVIPAPDKSDLIVLDSPLPNAVVSSPLTLTGKARGGWFFEASFPVTLTNWDGLIIGESYITAQGEWMTTEYVSFEGTLEFTNTEYGDYGFFILQKDNPSGEPQFDDAIEFKVLFK